MSYLERALKELRIQEEAEQGWSRITLLYDEEGAASDYLENNIWAIDEIAYEN